MNIKELAYVICQKKENVVKLNRKELNDEYREKHIFVFCGRGGGLRRQGG